MTDVLTAEQIGQQLPTTDHTAANINDGLAVVNRRDE